MTNKRMMQHATDPRNFCIAWADKSMRLWSKTSEPAQ